MLDESNNMLDGSNNTLDESNNILDESNNTLDIYINNNNNDYNLSIKKDNIFSNKISFLYEYDN